MKPNYLLLIFCLLSCSSLRGQATDVLDDYRSIIESCKQAEDPIDTFRQVLAPVLIQRRKTGPIDSALAASYHLVSVKLKDFDLHFAKPYTDTALQLRIQANALPSNIAQSYYEKGRVLTRLGHHQLALNNYQIAVSMMSEALVARDSIPGLARRLAYFLKEAAHSASENGNYQLANLWLGQIPQLAAIRITETTAYGATITQGDVYAAQGRFQEADDAYQKAQALPYFSKNASFNDQAVVYSNRGILYNQMHQPVAGEALLRKGLETFLNDENAKSINIASVYSALIRSLNLQGRYEEVQDALANGLRYALKDYPDGKGPVIGELYARAATTASLQTNFEKANSLLLQSADALLDQPVFYGSANLPILEGATVYGQQDVLEMLEAKRDNFIRAYDHHQQSEGLDLALATCHSIDTLLRLNRSRLSMVSSLGELIKEEQQQYTRAIDLALRLYRTRGEDRYLHEAYQFAAGQKSNLLRKYLNSPGLAESLGVPADLVEQKSALELRVLTAEEALQNASAEKRPALRSNLLRLNTEADMLRRRITERHPAFSRALRGLPAIDPRGAADKMADNQLLIEYFLSVDSIYLFTLRGGEGLSVITRPRPDDLKQMIGEVMDQGQGANQLYDLLVAPALALHPDIERLQFIPDGDLWSIPFGALRTPEANFLIQEKAISLAYAAPLLFDADLEACSGKAGQDYLGYGISYDGMLQNLSQDHNAFSLAAELRNLEQLPFAVREVEEADNIFGGIPRLEEAATKSRFINEAGGASILHLSMHGLLRFTNPLESALVFRGEDTYVDLLTMREVLSGHYPAELTVLSACHTGGGPLQTSEGIQTIGRAFTAAGSRATITSAWAARDEATYNILGRFFTELEAGRPKDLALQSAIKAYLKEGTKGDRQPEFWANLALTGIVAPIDNSSPWASVWLIAGMVLILGALFGWLAWRKRA